MICLIPLKKEFLNKKNYLYRNGVIYEFII